MKALGFVLVAFLSLVHFTGYATIALKPDTNHVSPRATNSEDKNIFREYYPIGDDPNITLETPMIKKYETILFEANPAVHYSFFNNMYKALSHVKNAHPWSIYMSFKPEVRMYTDSSVPVKTPSYRIAVGTQHAFKWVNREKMRSTLLAFEFETGHYSNGQDGGSFTTQYKDGSPQSDAIYNTITPSTNLSAILNRENGNFTTDLTEIVGNIRFNKINNDYIPTRSHSLKLGLIIYQKKMLYLFDVGGYSDNDIKIYGRIRALFGYEYMYTLKSSRFIFRKDSRLALTENGEIIFDAHPFVQPLRSESGCTYYFFPNMPQFGLFLKFIAGHDNYNYRFVDSGHQYAFGASWSIFPPFAIQKANR